MEGLEGKEAIVIKDLTRYRDSLYQIAEEIRKNEEAINRIESLPKQTKHMEDGIREHMKQNKYEIIFFPYKASMFDSMESLWLMAEKDPKCDAYVIPIPYYEKQSDGTLGRMHYEGNQYPDYVPVIDWRRYSVEEHRPDAVVIHNPYDDANYVTSVHPDYYAERLRNLTDLLVYIPYFVKRNSVGEKFCVLPGTLYSDKVFLQSEKIRKEYVRYFGEFEKSKSCEGAFGDTKTKFISKGSPKFDKVMSVKGEECKLPDKWKEMIEKPDGKKKKVILFNTTIADLLEGNEKVLRALPKTSKIW